jgi:hypothetical protein
MIILNIERVQVINLDVCPIRNFIAFLFLASVLRNFLLLPALFRRPMALNHNFHLSFHSNGSTFWHQRETEELMNEHVRRHRIAAPAVEGEETVLTAPEAALRTNKTEEAEVEGEEARRKGPDPAPPTVAPMEAEVAAEPDGPPPIAETEEAVVEEPEAEAAAVTNETAEAVLPAEPDGARQANDEEDECELADEGDGLIRLFDFAGVRDRPLVL